MGHVAEVIGRIQHARTVPAECLSVHQPKTRLWMCRLQRGEVLGLKGERLGGQQPNLRGEATRVRPVACGGVAPILVAGVGVANAPMAHDVVDEGVRPCHHPR